MASHMHERFAILLIVFLYGKRTSHMKNWASYIWDIGHTYNLPYSNKESDESICRAVHAYKKFLL